MQTSLMLWWIFFFVIPAIMSALKCLQNHILADTHVVLLDFVKHWLLER